MKVARQGEKVGIFITLGLQTIALVYFFATAKAILEADVFRLKRDVEKIEFSLRELERRVGKNEGKLENGSN